MHDAATICEYLNPPADAFWRWDADCREIVLANGKLVVFREELAGVLARLAPEGLPSLGAVVLLLAASRTNWASGHEDGGMLYGLLERGVDSPDWRDKLQRVLTGLDRVQQLPPDLRNSVGAKGVLAEAIFEGATRVVDAHQASQVVQALQPGVSQLWTDAPELVRTGNGHIRLLQDLHSLLDGLEQLDEESLRLRAAVGVDSLPTRAPVELPPAKMVRGVLQQLDDEEEHAGLARLARRLLACAALPRPLSIDVEQQCGGVSDLSNRGTPDRLLLSELANDGLTLAVRIAMNEALYLRREVPPSRPDQNRVLLIDSGIRCWGVPRLFATSLALALAAALPDAAKLTCFRAEDGQLQEVDLTTRTGVVRHLSALSTDLTPAAALEEFAKRLEDAESRAEPVLVLAEDTLADPEFSQALRAAPLRQVFLATVHRDGRLRMIERTERGDRRIREVQVEIDEILAQPASVIEMGREFDSPAIFRLTSFPLLLPLYPKPKRSWFAGGWGAFSVTSDGRLLLARSRNTGAQQLSDEIIARGRVWWTGAARGRGPVEFVAGTPSKLHLYRVDLDESVRRFGLDCREARGVAAHGRALLVVGLGEVHAFCLDDGSHLQSLQLPHWVAWTRGRFFLGRNPNDWYALAYDGHDVHLEKVTDDAPGPDSTPQLTAMFDRLATEGPLAITAEGDLYHTTNGVVQHIDSRPRRQKMIARGSAWAPWCSDDGRVVQVGRCCSNAAGHRSEHLIMVNTVTLDAVLSSRDRGDPRVDSVSRGENVRHRFVAIGFTGRSTLKLRSKKGVDLVFAVRQGLPVFMRAAEPMDPASVQPFQRIDADVHGRNYRLSEAIWSDGSRAILDSRGLLHLRSSNAAIPEVTLVLSEGELSGWCADGRLWGRPYFVGDAGQRSATEQREIFVATVTRFVEHIHA